MKQEREWKITECRKSADGQRNRICCWESSFQPERDKISEWCGRHVVINNPLL
jgi:hypothetical protein